MRKTNEKQNGNKRRDRESEVYYRHLGADVWEKYNPDSEKTDVAYSEEILEKMESEEDEQDIDPNASKN